MNNKNSRAYKLSLGEESRHVTIDGHWTPLVFYLTLVASFMSRINAGITRIGILEFRFSNKGFLVLIIIYELAVISEEGQILRRNSGTDVHSYLMKRVYEFSCASLNSPVKFDIIIKHVSGCTDSSLPLFPHRSQKHVTL